MAYLSHLYANYYETDTSASPRGRCHLLLSPDDADTLKTIYPFLKEAANVAGNACSIPKELTAFYLGHLCKMARRKRGSRICEQIKIRGECRVGF